MLLNELMEEQYKVFVDMDGVLADFNKLAQHLLGIDNALARFDGNPKLKKDLWKKVKEYQRTGGQMWFDLEPMPDARVLWNYLETLHREGKIAYPEILSATGNPGFGAAEQKKQWVKQLLGPHVKVHLTETAAQKAQYAGKNHILIDDRPKAIDPWEAAGGIGVLHTSASHTIEHLKKLGL